MCFVSFVYYSRIKRDKKYDTCEDPKCQTILFKFLPIYTRTVEETPNFHVKVNNKKILHVLVLSTVYNTYTLTIHLSYLNANKVNTKHFFATQLLCQQSLTWNCYVAKRSCHRYYQNNSFSWGVEFKSQWQKKFSLTKIREQTDWSENDHHSEKDHCMADLLFDWFRFDQTRKSVVRWT